MIESKMAIYLRDKLKFVWLIFFMLVMLIIGFIINCFEPYNLFGILAPILILMMSSTIYVLKNVVSKISSFREKYGKDEMFEQPFEPLFQADNRVAINFIFALMIFIYFICLYQLHFISLNMMGCYTLFLGGGTFFIALIGYELHIRLTKCLCLLAKQCSNVKLNYNEYNPKDTPWLFDLYKLSKLLRISSFVIGLLFVFENALFFVVNIDQTFNKSSGQSLPLELYIIWVFIFVTISLGLPIIAFTQINRLRNIVWLIEKDFKEKLVNTIKNEKPYKDIEHFLTLLQTIRHIEKSLDEAYLLKSGEKFVAIISAILTFLVHILSFFNFYLSNFV